MTELLTAAQMRAIEQAAIASGEVTGLELMERAGRGVVEAIFEEWPELEVSERGPAPTPPGYLQQEEKLRAVVMCGPGNNGGDGFVVARLLQARGWAVEVFLFGDSGRLPPDARVSYERWGEIGETRDLSPGALGARPGGNPITPEIWIDALFGTGLSRPVQDGVLGEALRTLCGIAEAMGPAPFRRVVAIDMPTGICADSGRILKGRRSTLWEDVSRLAHLTVSFHRAKCGHYLDAGPEYSGTIVVKDIGLNPFILPEILPPEAPEPTFLTEVQQVRDPVSKHSGHKYIHGHALVLSGGAGRTGAARLTARGALRIGAGLVTLGVPGSAQMEVASQITALMLRRVDDAAALTEALEDTRLTALCLGPGLGLSADKAALTEAALNSGRAVVLDADALTLLSREPALFARVHDRCVLTPHGGEFARLFPDIVRRLDAEPVRGPAYSKVDATREAAARTGCTVLFKGPDTVIADQTGRCSINSANYDRAAPWLATAGSGDVLAGFITGLLARGFAPMLAAETAAWLHVECARSFGPGLIAEDLPEELPEVFRNLGL